LIELANINHAVSESALKDLIKNLRFESILKYVQIPSYKLSIVPKGTNWSNHKRKEQQLVGKGDFPLIFNLLSGRGVKKIINVSVDDDGNSPHSDEAIESLHPFDVEEWDWRRVDLCSSVIYTAAKNARKIFLYSSGNKAVLRSWSAADGLSRFDKVREIAGVQAGGITSTNANPYSQLTDVHIFVQQHLESEERIRLYLGEFTTRLKSHKPHVNIHPRIQSGSSLVSDQPYFPGEDKVETYGTFLPYFYFVFLLFKKKLLKGLLMSWA
jgi:hypothetical protein